MADGQNLRKTRRASNDSDLINVYSLITNNEKYAICQFFLHLGEIVIALKMWWSERRVEKF